MRIPVIRHGRIAALACGIGLAGVFLAAMPGIAVALTPKSPEVREVVDRGIKFLESNATNEARIGGNALRGIALLTYGEEPTQPKIVEAAAALKKALADHDPTKLGVNSDDFNIYATGLSIIFLIELDPEKYHDEIECLLKSLQLRQKPHGGWGYPGRETGDTSMTQYGVLSSWEAKNAHFYVPIESIEGVATWLLHTQGPNGGFGYQGTIGTTNALVAQSEVKPSMTSAGSGSLYICASMLDLIEKREKRDGLAAALKEVKAKEPVKERVKTRIDVRLIREAESRSKGWMAANNKIDPNEWVHYYLYALERCMSFREIFDQQSEKEPKWYDEGAEFLMKTQTANGCWSGRCGEVPDTAFSVLFLMRGTKKRIEKALSFGEGTMVVGHGIPPNTDRLEVHGGQLVAKPLLGGAEKMLDLLDKPDNRDFDKSIDLLANLPSDKMKSLTAKYGAQIRQLVDNKSGTARLAAVRALGKTRDIDNVEPLLYALTDPDPTVVCAANEALLRIRRIPAAPTLPDNFTAEDRQLLIEKWKAWYQSIRPSAEVRY